MENKLMEFLEGVSQAGDCANMWQVGQAMGLDRGATETLATDLLAQGALEMVNLSGKVRLSESGRQICGGDDLARLLGDFQAAGGLGLTGEALQDMSADLATLKAQLTRSRPLPPVVTACLAALEVTLAKSRAPEAAGLAQRATALRN